jgi:prevent-host-death family protein
MVTEVRIAELKARLSDYLRSVRRGNELIVKDRETPVARIVPLPSRAAGFVTRPATRTFQEVGKLLASRPRKRIKMKPGTLEKAIRETKRDRLDPWTDRKSTSTRR